MCMSNLWIIFAITVLIAVYSGIEVFTNLNNKQQPRFKYFTIAFVIFIILAMIEIIFLARG
ncbi:Mid2-like cell wall stress sensor domain protein [Staphylococcus saccharolyticus]|nr:Mid2-like cell wall stress sensor domain protein [Staphylococcus saccharolyticus]TAA94675.1 Mid2-like cell wall stress sensor domain protein [Staphylococcus saccharolyticus]